MVDLAATLSQFQEALEAKLIAPIKCEIFEDLYVLHDSAGGEARITYAKIIKGKAQALVAYVPVEPNDGYPCFNVGYAVDPSCRNRGIGDVVLGQSLIELENGLSRYSSMPYFVEAIVAIDNGASNKLASKHISTQPTPIVCQVSGVDAFQYLRRFPQ
jgi:hypothetical protein